MVLDTRHWSAVLLTGHAPKLIVTGEARTHPYAFVSLAERRVFGGSPDTLYLEVHVFGDRPGLDVLDWRPVIFEQTLPDTRCEAVVIGGTGTPIRLNVYRLAAHAYARRRER